MEIGSADRSELAEELGAVLARLYGFLRRAVLPTEMSLTQAHALTTLRELGPQRVTDLAGIEGVRQPTCTGLVNTLEAQGWAARSVDETDRRVVLVELTPEGRAVLEDLTGARAAVLSRYLGSLSEEEREALARSLPGLKRLTELGTEGENGTGTAAGSRAVTGSSRS